MAIIENKKADQALSKLLGRQDFLVTQANELARALGNLSTFEHKVLDYAFSFVQEDDTPDKVYYLTALEIIKYLGLNTSGDSYVRVAKAFKGLNENTALYIRTVEPNGQRAILMTSLFSHIKMIDDGRIEFGFSQKVAPYVFKLKERYYSFRLSELTQVRSKYTLALMKLWNAHSKGKWRNYDDPASLPPHTLISGTLEEWEEWFLGSDENGKPIRWPAGRFKKDALNVAYKELGRLYPQTLIDVTTNTRGRRTVGYTIEFKPIHARPDTPLKFDTLVIDGVVQPKKEQ